MSESSPESTKPSTDTINVLPILSEAKAPVSLTLTIDKSVGKIAGWLIGLLVGFAFLSAFALAMAYMARDQAIKTETEFQLVDDWMQQHGIRKVNGRYQVIEERGSGE